MSLPPNIWSKSISSQIQQYQGGGSLFLWDTIMGNNMYEDMPAKHRSVPALEAGFVSSSPGKNSSGDYLRLS